MTYRNPADLNQSDFVYFQGLYDTALDFTMKAFWGNRIQELNNGVLEPCVHARYIIETLVRYGTYFTVKHCSNCGTLFDPHARYCGIWKVY